jgi:type IV secretory pathway VirB10-like protein
MLFRFFEFTAVASIVLVHFAMLIRFNELSAQLLSRHEEAVSHLETKTNEIEESHKIRVSTTTPPPPPTYPSFPSFPPPAPTSFEFKSVPIRPRTESNDKPTEQTTTRPMIPIGEARRRPPTRQPNAYWQEKAKERLAQARREQDENAIAKDPELTLPKRPQLPSGE